MSSQKRLGHQQGLQGYSGEDCTALIKIIKGILPREAMSGNVSTNVNQITPSRTTECHPTLGH
ncbi:hypothetical protein VP01_8581g1 [Puccinia sorghi]|uniref:Uncharacterized protein n=1 Tax=Puccinia sorghi TaxID=27349 RepID=A0A0L6U924_9BASI|nr:hypothetical protein VP01_8581g1 [Puccinia sorghi]